MSTPLQTLLRESLDSAQDYFPRLKNGLEGVAVSFEEGDRAGALARLSLALKGIGWLLGIYDRCREFVAAPIRMEEEAAMRSELLSAMRRLVDQAEAGNDMEAARRIRQELLPRVETLGLRTIALRGFNDNLYN